MKTRTDILAILKSRKVAFAIVTIIFAVLVADMFVGRWQDNIIKEKEAKIKRLEDQAFRMLSVEIRDIAETVGIDRTGRYEASLRIDNVGEEPAYITHPTVKAYIQTGSLSWTEMPVTEKAGEKQEQVYKIEEGHRIIKKILTVPPYQIYNKNLIPKYMHMRFYIIMNVLPESGFKEGEVVERKSNTYLYLKPFWVSEQEVRKVIDFGDTKVPVYMPISAFRNWSQN